MRPIVLASALLAALAISATAHATPVTSATTYFSFSEDGGPTGYFSLNSSVRHSDSPGEQLDYAFFTVSGSDGFGNSQVLFDVPTFFESGPIFGEDFGPADFQIICLYSLGWVYDGPQLFTDDGSNPSFIAGTYDLTADIFDAPEYTGTAHLVISASALLPEPSSLLLLGTGVLGCVGAIRRRFVKA